MTNTDEELSTFIDRWSIWYDAIDAYLRIYAVKNLMLSFVRQTFERHVKCAQEDQANLYQAHLMMKPNEIRVMNSTIHDKNEVLVAWIALAIPVIIVLIIADILKRGSFRKAWVYTGFLCVYIVPPCGLAVYGIWFDAVLNWIWAIYSSWFLMGLSVFFSWYGDALFVLLGPVRSLWTYIDDTRKMHKQVNQHATLLHRHEDVLNTLSKMIPPRTPTTLEYSAHYAPMLTDGSSGY